MGFGDIVASADRACMAILGGELVTYTPEDDGVPVQVTGIFDANYELVKGDALAGVSALGPAVFFRIEDLPTDDPTQDNPTITIKGIDYRTTEAKPDDMGGIVFMLRVIS